MLRKALGLFLMSPVVTVFGDWLRFSNPVTKEELIAQLLSIFATWLFVIGCYLFFVKDKQ